MAASCAFTAPMGARVDVEPLGGRLVCFLTAGREHEVLPAQRERFSISGWYREREAALADNR